MPSTDELVQQLDPNRDYGPRTFEQVKEEIARGAIVIEPGLSLPVLKDVASRKTIKGTGLAAVRNPAEWSRSLIREKFAGDAEALYEAAKNAVLIKGDMKALELLLKYGVGDHREQGSDAGSRAVDALMQLATNARTERVIQVNQ